MKVFAIIVFILCVPIAAIKGQWFVAFGLIVGTTFLGLDILCNRGERET